MAPLRAVPLSAERPGEKLHLWPQPAEGFHPGWYTEMTSICVLASWRPVSLCRSDGLLAEHFMGRGSSELLIIQGRIKKKSFGIALACQVPCEQVEIHLSIARADK